MHPPIVVVGSINLDLVCTGKRIPAPGETVTGSTFRTFHGGKGANQAVAIARLGYPVAMIGKVGDDEFGPRLRQGLKNAGVDVQNVATAPDTSSGVALISVDTRGQNSITVVPGANGQLLPQDLDQCLPHIRAAGMLLAQLEIPAQTVEHLAELAGRFNIPLMLDPAPARRLPRKLLRNVAYLTPNEAEACTLCGIPRNDLLLAIANDCAQQLLAKGAKNVVVKLGRRGALLASSDGLRASAPRFKVHAVDTTAAGDAFNGGLAVALSRGLGRTDALRFASAVGALSVTRHGAQPAMPAQAETDAFLKAAAAADSSR